MELIAIHTTLGTREDAVAIARRLVERRLVACAQISEIDSVYHWDDALQQDHEYRLVLKTLRASYPAVEAALRELHPYELPAIFALPVVEAFDGYADWVADQLER